MSSVTCSSSWRTRFGPSPVAFILGNEGGDMDSVVCSFLTCKLISRASSLATFPSWIKPLQRHTCVPVCNFSKSDLSLRQDIILAFEKSQIQMFSHHNNNSSSNNNNTNICSSLCFSDEMPFLQDPRACEELAQNNDCIILVDHNVPAPNQQHLSPFVRGIIDHHALAPEPLKLNRGDDDDCVQLIETIGSASSLVARLFHQLRVPLSPNEAQLLLSPILMDTHNFNPASKKAVLGDFQARDFLFKIISAYKASTKSACTSAAPVTFDEELELAKALFVELGDARESYEKLSVKDALKKDTKLFHFATAASGKSIAMPIASWGEHLQNDVLKRFPMEQLLKEMIQFCDERGPSTDGSMAMFHRNHQRHLIFFAKSEAAQRGMKEFFHLHAHGSNVPPTFTNLTEALIAIKPAAVGETEGDRTKYTTEQFGAYLFDDSTISRKLLTPSLTDFFLTFHM